MATASAFAAAAAAMGASNDEDSQDTESDDGRWVVCYEQAEAAVSVGTLKEVSPV